MLAVAGTFHEIAHTAEDGTLLPSATKGISLKNIKYNT